jgi:cation diffusion facilitator CzcD-associated flavoprotein CzcO
VIGAGPYGLSVAAHLRARGVETKVFGGAMEFWRGMPPGMFLKSPWSASSLSDPNGDFSIDRFAAAGDHAPIEPIPVPYFLSYAAWFARHAVGEVNARRVESVTANGSFALGLSDGSTQPASRVIVAVGIQSFAHIPGFARELPIELASHSQTHSDLSRFKGQTVAVIGAGQSALESAALLHEAGAEVELIARGPIIWIKRTLYGLPGPLKRIFYPPTDVGPPGLNWIIAFPLLVRFLPERARLALRRRAMRPAGAKWLRERVDGEIKTMPHTTVRGAVREGERVRLQLSDGTTRVVDHVLLGTGFRPDLEKIAFLDRSLHARIQSRQGFPVLDPWFESSVPGLHFVGSVAGYDFGPLCNFVAGTRLTAGRVARRAADRA